MSEITEFELDWEGIKILIKHTHKAWGVIEHIELHSIDPPEAELPMTDTGYISHYIDESYIEAEGGVESYVLAWLKHDAAKPSWQAKKLSARQYSLF